MALNGVIDIGSNTIRLAVYEVEGENLNPLFSKKTTAGLASYIDKKGQMSKEGIEKAIWVLNEFKHILNNITLDNLYVFATASLRNIINSNDAVKQITEKTGFKIDLISGEEEGIYDFRGVSLEANLDNGLLVDVGGGSTEFVFYKNGRIKESTSVPIGSLNLYKKYVKEIIPTKKEIKKMNEFVEQVIDLVTKSCDFDFICGVGGTARASYQLNNLLFEENPSNKVVETNNLCKMIEDFCNDTRIMTKKVLKTSPERIHTIVPGMIILNQIANKYSAGSIHVSTYGVREGYLYSKLFLDEK